MAKKSPKYDDSSIQVLEGLEAVRKRPGMYIGSTDSRGLHHLVYEIVDNAVDEALAGYGKEINVIIHADNSITVVDHGRGMPVGMHASGIPTPEVILTVLHAGGKFGQGGYKTSGGLHGVGASVVNALSSELTVTIVRDGYRYVEHFKDGGHPVGTLEKKGKTNKPTGTTMTFKPDASIFTTTVYNFQTLAERLRASGIPTPEVILTVLHAGGKFGQGGYKTSGGLHGVGASVVNALSSELTVTIVRDGYRYVEHFKDGGHPVGTLEKKGKTNKPTGTTMTFKPDASIFTTTVYNFQTLAERLRESAFLLKGVKIRNVYRFYRQPRTPSLSL
ncbi:hypothetical protein WP50_22440 [Lactiplantibacillus plantarum]|nr:hypothetical protein WP50_22440 [Lactiplantibacillus plantarum]